MQRRRYERARAPLARGATGTKVGFAADLRSAPTAAERELWEHLRGRRLSGFKFRRQHLLVGYVADFYCPALRLVVEVDGASHEDRQAYDRERSRLFESYGLAIIRFTNAEILLDLESVLERIEALCRAQSTSS